MRAEPDIKAAKQGKLAHGDTVIIQSISDKTFNLTAIAKSEIEQNPYILTGTWVKIKSGKKEAYVLDVFLLKYQPPIEKDQFSTLYAKYARRAFSDGYDILCRN